MLSESNSTPSHPVSVDDGIDCTYSGSGDQNQWSAGQNSVCRACLRHDADIHLFREHYKLAHKFTECTDLKVAPGDGYPENICVQCCTKLSNFYEFRKKCFNSYDVMRKSIKLNDCNKTEEVFKTKEDETYKINDSFSGDSYSLKQVNAQGLITKEASELNEHKHKEDDEHEWTQEIESSDNIQDFSLAIKQFKLRKDSFAKKLNTEENSNNQALANDGEVSTLIIPKKRSVANKRLNCGLCRKTFKSEDGLNEHLHFHKLKTKKRLDTNNRNKISPPIVNPQVKWICSTCKEQCYTFENFENHLKTHVLQSNNKCNFCGKIFKLKETLRVHKKLHSANRRTHHCDVCNKNFRNIAYFKFHQQTHNGVNMCMCHMCGKSLQEVNLKEHLLRHSKVKNYPCRTCSKSYMLSGARDKHELRHKPEKNFSCANCDMSFYTKQEIQRHMNSHSDKKLFPCNMCDKSIRSHSYLTVHKRIHTGERPYRCDLCTWSFKRGKELRTHRMIHTGERPYQCQQCEKGFTQKIHLNRHLQVHIRRNNKHNDKKSDDTGYSREQTSSLIELAKNTEVLLDHMYI